MGARGSLPPHKLENLSARKSNTCVKGNTAPVPPNKRLPLACQRPAGLALNCLLERQRRVEEVLLRQEEVVHRSADIRPANQPARVRALPSTHCVESAGIASRERICPNRLTVRRASVVRRSASNRQRRPFEPKETWLRFVGQSDTRVADSGIVYLTQVTAHRQRAGCCIITTLRKN
jgi:hypothetical protein